MNFSEILTFVRQRIKKLPESPFPHTYIDIYYYTSREGNNLYQCGIKRLNLAGRETSMKLCLK
jgi:hypothetical protein